MPEFLKNKGHFITDELIGTSLLTALGTLNSNNKYLIIVSNLYKAQKVFDYLSGFLPKEKINLFLDDELIRASAFSFSKEFLASRIFSLDSLVNSDARIVICNVSAATRYLPDPKEFLNSIINLKIGDNIELSTLKDRLIKNGYSFVNKIDQTFEFAVRGDILDVFSASEDNPIRIEFFDNEIESIRYFDISRQESIKKVDKIKILPAFDFLLNDDEKKSVSDRILSGLDKAKGILSNDNFEKLRDLSVVDIDNILNNNFNVRNTRYYSFLQDKHFSIFDYTVDFVKVFVEEESLQIANQMLIEESFDFLRELFENGEMISSLSIYSTLPKSNSFKKNSLTISSLLNNNDSISFDVRAVNEIATKNEDAYNLIRSYLNKNHKIVLCISNNQQMELLVDLFEKESISYQNTKDLEISDDSQVSISFYFLNNGFSAFEEKITYLTSKELFNERNHASRYFTKFKEATVLKSFEDLNPGDYVVHESYGIGQFIELQNRLVNDVHTDFLKIAYAGTSVLYVPLSQFQLIRKYQGQEGAVPRLTRLGTKDWEKTKKRIKERINLLATRLFNLYKERSSRIGTSFNIDDDFQKEFENDFPYELTLDQKKAVSEIKTDMEKSQPMDRLLCGDVGFGKTEVAFIAAFKAINNGKQVALLCPTTLLARQHYELALERFRKFDVKIALFSRFVPEKKEKEYIKGIKDGTIHFAIGTHRLLSKDIAFNNLGLLIIDEEQRFGVEQKEKIKELKSDVDVLSLSATPIPRTLQISLLGVRGLSQINTPPINRVPIQTYVVPFDMKMVKELIERELGRNGQVFYLHNDISTIYNVASYLNKNISGAKIAVGHGQMEKDELEKVMVDFYNGTNNILVCTTIIENGIDVPNANLIIVDDCTKFGLSQLYQIKGRVGRSDRIAYAYLMYNAKKILSDITRKRLEAIKEFSQLGDGYKIAKRDLMIRGAGDILGPDQSGYIDSIGLDMYLKLLNETVEAKVKGEDYVEKKSDMNSSLRLDAFIPSEFADDKNKIELYQSILSTSSLDSLSALKLKVRDNYGRLPSSVELLFKKREIDLFKNEIDAKKLMDNGKDISFDLGSSYLKIKGVGNILFEALLPYINFTKVYFADNEFHFVMKKRETFINDLLNIFNSLKNVLNQGGNKDEA